MKRTFAFTIAAALTGLFMFSALALAAKPPGAGNGGGSGNEPPDYGDLVVLLRDSDGVPMLNNETDKCQQPIAFPSDTCSISCPAEPCLVPINTDTCAVDVGYQTCTQEVDFGRINEARSTDSVFEAQLDDVVVNLATADCITLDPAGRLVGSTVVENEDLTPDEVLTSTIDSPLQNLAIYRQLMSEGYLGDAMYPLELPGGDPLQTAARGLGAASGKSGEVGVDLVVYLNEILGLTELDMIPLLQAVPLCIEVREEVMGVVQEVEKCFLDYGSYQYDRTGNFGVGGLLPDPAYIPEDNASTDENESEAGWFEYLKLAEPAPELGRDLFYVEQGPIMAAEGLFENDPGYMAGNIGGFAQAADDTRAVIEFMHNNPIPLGYETPVPILCVISGDPTYDVSISDVSGLQVPVRMVAGTEGREFTVTVANAGPDVATGYVEVTAVDADDEDIQTFPRSFDFVDLVAGTSEGWTQGFNIDYKTTVTWTATAHAEFDVSSTNNEVTETTKVTGTGGGGGGGP